MDPTLTKLLLLARLVAFMALVYLLFGLLVEWRSRQPESRLRAFARLLCSPLTGVTARFLPAATPYRQVLRSTALGIGLLWLLLVAASAAGG